MHIMPGASLLPYCDKQPQLGDGVFVADGARLIGDLVIGAESSIWFNVTVRADCHYIRIGSRTNIQDNTVIHVTNQQHPTILGDDVTVGHGVILHGCEVKSGSLIGMGAVIMDDVVVGEQCLVAAGSLLTPGKQFPPRHLIKGSPAKASRPLRDDELQSLSESVDHYLEYKANYVPLTK